MEFGEDFESVVRREVKEEYGVDALEVHHRATTNLIRQNGDVTTHWVCLIHTVLIPEGSGEIGEPHKMDEIGWFAYNAFPNPIHPGVPPHFELVRDHIVPQQD